MYHREGKLTEFQQILTAALSSEDKRANPHLFESAEERIQCFNALSLRYLQLSLGEANGERYKSWQEVCIHNLN